MRGNLSVKAELEIVIMHEIPQCFWQIIFSEEQTINGCSDLLLIYKLKPGEGDGDKGEEPI